MSEYSKEEDRNKVHGVNQVKNGKWTASIYVNGKYTHLGTFENFENAVKARLDAEEKYGYVNGISPNKINPPIKTTHKYRNKYPRLYSLWAGIKQRCFNEKCVTYKYYGGRGISMIDEWKNSSNLFCEWAIKNGWEEGLELDRVDVDGDYEPNNCQFVNHDYNVSTGKTRMRSHNKTGYNGVRISKGKYVVEIYENKKYTRIGSFENLNEAVEARIDAEIRIFGEQKTNFHYERGR